MWKRALNFNRNEETQEVGERLFSPYFFMAYSVYVKTYIYFGTFEIQNLSFMRFHNNTNLSQEKNNKASFLCKESRGVEKY